MSDITAEEYRTAAKVLQSAEFTGFCGRFPGEASWCQSEAARLEAESARDEYVEQLAIVQHMAADNFVSGFVPWGQLSDSAQAAYRVGMRAVLDRLAADGRLLPESGPQAVCRIYCGTPHPEHGVRCTMPEGHSGDHGHPDAPQWATDCVNQTIGEFQ